MDHRSTTTMAVVRRKRNWMQGPAPQWDAVHDNLHMTIKDATAELDVPVSYLRRLCKENGYSSWPGKSVRYMNGTGRLLMMLQEDAPEGSPWAGLAAGPSQPAKVAETKKKEKKELVTLNLIDKIGSSTASSKGN